ncbi:MAG: hypothetical protein IJC55_00510 [Clostridia bacterium]|nr:hypothetical protein [Clostridia bacterium]
MTNLYTQDTRILGRYLPNASGEGLTLAWTNSGIEFEFFGTAAYLDLATDTKTALLGVFVDGESAHSSLLQASTASKKYTLAENLPLGTHTIKLLKLSEANQSRVKLGTLQVNGKDIEPTVAKQRVIEFIGDSITCGFGTLAESSASPYAILEQDASLAYPYLIAEHFGADGQYISRSGIGILGNSGNGTETMPEVYQYASYKQQAGLAYSAMTKWSDVAHETPDAIVINLGTNDHAYYNNTAPFVAEYKEFLATVRALNPNAVIFVTYGVMYNNLNTTIRQLVEDMNDPKMQFVDIWGASYDLQGAGGHPSASDHQKIAEILIDSIGDKMMWN